MISSILKNGSGQTVDPYQTAPPQSNSLIIVIMSTSFGHITILLNHPVQILELSQPIFGVSELYCKTDANQH